MDEYMGIIKIFASNFAPKAYAFCAGQTMQIAQNTALYSLLGTIYGGNGTTTFNLPDLRGRIPVGAGAGAGLSPINLGQVGGVESATMTTAQMPYHTHYGQVIVTPPVNADGGNTDSPEAAYLSTAGINIYNTTPGGQFAAPFSAQASLLPAGGSQPIPLRNPYLGMNYVICVNGVFPPRN